MKDLNKYLKDLPVIPDVALKIISLAEDNVDLSFHDLEEIIKIDTAITSKILKVANSALYARQTEIKSVEKAISLLGFKTIKNLVLIISATSVFKSESNQPFFKEFWSNSVLTAFYSKELALYLSEKAVAEDVFLAGLIHKIGQVALFRENPEYYKCILQIKKDDDKELHELEYHYFNTNHKEVGSEILKEWSFPELFIDSTKEYGSTNIVSKYKKEIIIISLADLMAKEVINSTNLLDNLPKDNQWIEYLGFSHDEFIEQKAIIIDKVDNDRNFKECKNIFL